MDAAQTEQIASTAARVTEGMLPVLLPFDPFIKILIHGIVMAHYNASQKWPTPEEVTAALPADWKTLVGTWASWRPSGDGTLAKS